MPTIRIGDGHSFAHPSGLAGRLKLRGTLPEFASFYSALWWLDHGMDTVTREMKEDIR
jgi:hypothetical protein